MHPEVDFETRAFPLHLPRAPEKAVSGARKTEARQTCVGMEVLPPVLLLDGAARWWDSNHASGRSDFTPCTQVLSRLAVAAWIHQETLSLPQKLIAKAIQCLIVAAEEGSCSEEFQSFLFTGKLHHRQNPELLGSWGDQLLFLTKSHRT